MLLKQIFETEQIEKNFLTQLKQALERLNVLGVQRRFELSVDKDDVFAKHYLETYTQELQKVKDVINNAKTPGAARKAMRTILSDWRKQLEFNRNKLLKKAGKEFHVVKGFVKAYDDLLKNIYPLNFNPELDKNT